MLVEVERGLGEVVFVDFEAEFGGKREERGMLGWLGG
jgi:hypothetical protein